MKKETVRTGAALAVSVLLALIYAVIVYKGTGFLYAIADDVIMRDIASGAFTGTPDGHLIFIRYVLGFCISRLYMLNRTVDWYGYFMAGALFLGLAAVLPRSFRRKDILLESGLHLPGCRDIRLFYGLSCGAV